MWKKHDIYKKVAVYNGGFIQSYKKVAVYNGTFLHVLSLGNNRSEKWLFFALYNGKTFTLNDNRQYRSKSVVKSCSL